VRDTFGGDVASGVHISVCQKNISAPQTLSELGIAAE